ncbi:hypothetical protein EXIGLDRAFT_287839 [Exidia glandulosa HHB12029]|uniref:Uncharacterized protein n=1 Tax=Exidia glandulosa HHB12029 TaxID=1314781 RepID=A0A165DH68_EXIGL|nr:hypothetical protein EXIGLDRAFT_287839 [Exidia glandulosa HHB12029]
MINHKNTYVVATEVSNTVKQKFYESDLPRLEDQFQLLQGRLINQLVTVIDRSEGIHLHHLEALRGRHTQVQEALKTVDTAADQALFIEFNRRPFAIPAPLQFEPCPDFYDTGEITSAGDSTVFLQNRLARSRGKLSEVRPVIQSK